MKKLLKNNFVIVALSTLIIASIILAFNTNKVKEAKAVEIDYTAQKYTDIPYGFNVASEDIIFKVHCVDIRTKYGISEVQEYVTIISFRASMGCQIYFVNGVACCLEDSDYGDYEWNYYSNYYEILHYDQTNNFVYFKFKNLSQLDNDDKVSGDLEDLSIFNRSKNDYVNEPQYIYVSNIEQPATEITVDDFYFATEVKPASGRQGWTDYNIYSIEYTLKLNQKVSHLVERIQVSFLQGEEDYALYVSEFTTTNGIGENGYINFDVITLGDIGSVLANVQLQATINYGDKTITVQSSRNSLIGFWEDLVSKDFVDYGSNSYMSDKNKIHVRKIVETYNSGFYTDIKGCENYFAEYKSETDLKLTSIIFKLPLTNINYADFTWLTEYWQGYVYKVKIGIDSEWRLTTEAYKEASSSDGIATGEIQKSEDVATAVYNGLDYMAIGDFLYMRIKDDTAITNYFPQGAKSTFNVTVKDANFLDVPIYVNTATIIYDEYNAELLEQINNLNVMLSDLEKLLETSNSVTESQRELISELQSSIDGLRIDYDNAQRTIEGLNEQMEMMRVEYQNKVEQFIKENEKQEPSDEEKGKEEPEIENGGVIKIIGIAAAVLLPVAIISLLVARRKK